MIILLASPDAFDLPDIERNRLAQVFIQTKNNNNPTAILSNNEEPNWFDGVFGGSKVQFLHSPGRQNGIHLRQTSEKFNLQPHDTLVLAHNRDDIAMGKNGGAVVLGASWAAERQVAALGIQISDADELAEIVRLTEHWNEQWWYTATSTGYDVRVLGDLSTMYKPVEQEKFGRQLTRTVKNGGTKLNALLALTARSALAEGLGSKKNTLWGTFPSSDSSNQDQEVLSDFCHRLRTTVSRCQFCKKGEPLFIRHKRSSKRSTGGAQDRVNPEEQLLTLHLNPFYTKSGRLTGRNVVVIDDCMTYGTSFAVAAAFLRSAGARSVICIALGKFGNVDRNYDIEITGKPDRPLTPDDYCVNSIAPLRGIKSTSAQQSLITLI